MSIFVPIWAIWTLLIILVPIVLFFFFLIWFFFMAIRCFGGWR